MKRRFAYDTEFLEDGKTIDLISIGIVCEDGREYYAVNADCDFDRIKQRDWLMRNVVPHLPVTGRRSLTDYVAHPSNVHPRPSINLVGLDRSDARVKPHWVIANEVREFLLREGEPELWAYYGAYDHIALCQLFGAMIDLPQGLPMFTHDIMQALEQRPGFVLPPPSPDAHDALADARWDMEVLRNLEIVVPMDWGDDLVATLKNGR